MMPLHDRGQFHTPLNITAIADPEPIDRVLDINLGCHIITPRGRTTFPFSGQRTVTVLNFIANSRKQPVCQHCFEEHQKQQLPPCSCTLRSRFLDRWLCLPCYEKEKTSDMEISNRVELEDHGDHSHIISRTCGCGAKLSLGTDLEVMCNWCKGAIGDILADETDDSETTKETASADGEAGEDDENHTAADFLDLPADTPGFAENRDGSLSVYVNGDRIRGNQLSRSLITSWLSRIGVQLPCTCCHCADREPHHHHSDDVDSTDVDVDESDDDEEEPFKTS
ncbi:uncharacterized protein K460DRAFT_286338 [Cucurbitaria berberidis CBS 394.84]|uniref:Uncharacterized protein n=1 Tax=Cucurbitaria berberidis CBS 394.84 TaxID=1168544 RepID=A0A9P4L8U8_9PLEO|nr:uncharacterized protein K460DRAFT_286338 [Cucurbitaria berberidis CBS 394.84]KAF1846425.1 hypothetical protein K460DRAFT_286338 [Cucurbitaria berberidis CBS 394.84]